MEGDLDSQVRAEVAARRAGLREVAFPVAPPAVPERLITVARMLKVDPLDLVDEEAADDIPDFWPLLDEHRPTHTNESESDMSDDSEEEVVSVGWDEVDKTIGSGGKWLKIADGQTVMINIFGTPRHVKREFQGKINDRVSIEVFAPGEGLKTWEVSQATYREIREERDSLKGNAFSDALFKVKRTGAAKDTRYRFRFERQLTAQEIAERIAADAKATAEIPF